MTTYRLTSGDRVVGHRVANTPLQALFDYLRSLGCQDEEIMKLGTDIVSWRGAVYRAVETSGEVDETDPPG